MASDAVYSAIRTYLEANWSDTPLLFENEPDAEIIPDPPAPWVAVEVTGQFLKQIEIGSPGSNTWLEQGVLWLHCFVPIGSGSLVARQHLKNLANLFRDKTVAFVVFSDASIGLGEPGDDEKKWWRLSMSIEWGYQDH